MIDPLRRKQLKKGLEQLAQEGTIQLYRPPDGRERRPMLGAVGQLQLEVVKYRLASEYDVEVRLEPVPSALRALGLARRRRAGRPAGAVARADRPRGGRRPRPAGGPLRGRLGASHGRALPSGARLRRDRGRRGRARRVIRPVVVAIAATLAEGSAACNPERSPAPSASAEADGATPPCAPLAAYCRPSDAVLLWGRCDERWDEEVLLACATSPANVAVKIYADCGGYSVASQRGVDFGRDLYFDSSKHLVGVEESFKQKHCYGVVPALDASACTLSRKCGGSAL